MYAMADLSIHEFDRIPKEELRKKLKEEARKMFCCDYSEYDRKTGNNMDSHILSKNKTKE